MSKEFDFEVVVRLHPRDVTTEALTAQELMDELDAAALDMPVTVLLDDVENERYGSYEVVGVEAFASLTNFKLRATS